MFAALVYTLSGWALAAPAQTPMPPPAERREQPRDDAPPPPELPPEQQLLYLLLQEKNLLEYYGPDHPKICATRGRIAVLREYLAQQPAARVQQAVAIQPAEGPQLVPPPAAPVAAAPPRPVRWPEPIILPVEPPPPPPIPHTAVLSMPRAAELPAPKREAPAAAVAVEPAPPAPVMPKAVEEAAAVAVLPKDPPVVAVVETPRPAAVPVAEEAAPEVVATPLLYQALAYLLGLFPALVVGLLLQAAVFLWLLRRYGPSWAPVVRVELVNAAAGLAVAPEPAAPPRGEETTAQAFDLGPTFEEERQQRLLAEQQKEEAVMRQVFQQNLQLRDAIEAAG